MSRHVSLSVCILRHLKRAVALLSRVGDSEESLPKPSAYKKQGRRRKRRREGTDTGLRIRISMYMSLPL